MSAAFGGAETQTRPESAKTTLSKNASVNSKRVFCGETSNVTETGSLAMWKEETHRRAIDVVRFE